MAHQFYFVPYILDNLPAPNTGFDVVQDLAQPRLRLYVTSHGVKTFFVRRRIGGRDKRIIIGNYPEIDIEDARAAAANILDSAATPAAPTRRNKTEFRKLVGLYLVHRVRRSDLSRAKLIRAIDMHLMPLFEKNVRDITPADITDTLDKIDGPAIAARMHELLQSIFNFAIDQGYRADNPMCSVTKRTTTRRTRPLTDAGLRRLLTAIRRTDPTPQRAAFEMLIYGFAPKSKIFSMQWRDLDFNHYMWDTMPLSDRAAVLLRDMPQNGRWVFPGRIGRPLTDPRTAWHAVATAARIPDLTMDDVHKFLMRRLTWASDREEFRHNMNALLDAILE
ncbi:integrase family protein [bacterium]|nr:integrase family protein [bacterium]